MLVTHQERPRELRWYHAGPMLYGDWGTSRFYVLGIALALSFHASFFYVVAVGMLVAAVGWAYTIICRCYPDGGGVYSAARHTSRNLAVVGALLLFADYIVTAAMSAYDGIRYMGVDKAHVPWLAMLAIFAVGVINFIGPRKAGTVALIITLATLVLTAILAVFCVPHLVTGWSEIHAPTQPVAVQWSHFVGVVLALSGVEAIANMTGIMVPPVTKTANKAIWPVLCEVVMLNIVLAVAMNGLPKAGYDLGVAPKRSYENVEQIQKDYPTWQTDAQAQKLIKAEADLVKVDPSVLTTPRSAVVKEHQDFAEDAVLRVMASVYVHPWFGWICGFVFGALLLSAVNTAVADMVSIQYVMSRDTELPHVLTKLNMFGVPWYALIGAVGLPILILTMFQDVGTLANLYAVGVVGAIAINLGSCCVNKQMPVKNWERMGMGVLALIMIVIEATLVYEKPDARWFALFVLSSGLIARFFTKNYPVLAPVDRAKVLVLAGIALVIGAGVLMTYSVPLSAGLHELIALLKYGNSALYAVYTLSCFLLLMAGSCASTAIRYIPWRRAAVPAGAEAAGVAGAEVPVLAEGAIGTPAEQLDMDRPHIMVAARGGERLIDFAASYARDVRGILFVVYVRQINVAFSGPVKGPALEEDPEAQGVFKLAAAACRRTNVQMVPIYVVSPDVAYSILDFAATYAVRALLMGVSRKATLLRALHGDVLTAVADNLPGDIPLLIHA